MLLLQVYCRSQEAAVPLAEQFHWYFNIHPLVPSIRKFLQIDPSWRWLQYLWRILSDYLESWWPNSLV